MIIKPQLQDTLLGMGSICFLFDSSLLGRLNSVIARLIHNDLHVSKHYCIANKTDISIFLSCPRVRQTRFRCLHWEGSSAGGARKKKGVDAVLTDGGESSPHGITGGFGV